MNAEGFLTLQDFLSLSGKEGAECSARYDKLQLYEVRPWEFLSFAREDLEGGSDRGRLNAIGNASRAIACRVDEILTLSNLRLFMTRERWSLPYKLQVIRKLGGPAPYVLRGYITSIRNVLEHEYKRPPELEQIRYVADIGELFLRATDEYVGRGYMQSATVSIRQEQERRQERGKETRVIHCENLTVEFDLASDALKLRYSEGERTEVSVRATGQLTERETGASEPITTTLSLADCNKEDVVGLIRLVS